MSACKQSELTASERSELDQLEARIEAGRKTFVEVGSALERIRTGKLYRLSHETFEEYLLERWAMHRNQAYRLMDAARVVGNLSPIGDIPANESQARPLVGLEPEEANQAWQEASADGPPTASRVQEAVDRLRSLMPQIDPTRAEVEREEGRVRNEAQRDSYRDLVQAIERSVQKTERLIGRLDSGHQEKLAEPLRQLKVEVAGL